MTIPNGVIKIYDLEIYLTMRVIKIM